jgi:hypothetical protein
MTMIAGTLTVKQIEADGHESITPATSVEFFPAADGRRAEVVAFGIRRPVSDCTNRYGNGRIYVTNEAGATVALYDLD